MNGECRAGIVASRDGLELDTRRIPAAEIRTLASFAQHLGVAPRNPGINTWSFFIVPVEGEPERVPLGGHGAAASSAPLDDLVAAMNRALRNTAA
jgi:hypothetical protein